MTFDEALEQVRELLQSKGRVAYRALKRRFAIDDEYLEDLKAELIDVEQVALDEDGKVLVWVGASPVPSAKCKVQSAQSLTPSTQPPTPNTKTPDPRLKGSRLDAAERRQLTVMFCDLVGSTALSAQLDPEELREVIRAYQDTCTTVIRRYDGHIAQHLGDGLLVYFGYPLAHEDDAARAVRAGLEIITVLAKVVPSPLRGEGQGEGEKRIPSPDTPHPNFPLQRAKEFQKLQVRIGIHTGPVVIGEIGGSDKREMLALGETPNLAARIQGQAEPDTVFISAATYRLVEGLFECEDRGQPTLKGVATPLTLYHVLKEGEAQSRFQVVARKGLTPLVGREHEFGLLCERWERVQDGEGQIVLVSGEPGIGKSRLVEALKDSLKHEGVSCLELRCSPHHQNSAFYPVIEHLHRVLRFEREDSPEAKLKKLEEARVGAYGYTPLQPDAVPLLAALLSLPHPENYPPLTLSPQKQKQKTQEALVAWIVEEAERQVVYCVWEDLHWADPSTLDLLTLFLDQIPTARLMAVLTFRPDFTPPWRSRSHITQLTLNRLGRQPVEAMIEKLIGGGALPAEVVQQIVSKTDGVPLFVEELTKTVIESGFDVGARRAVPLPLSIPSTLQDSLMARLDRLGAAKEIAQVGATIGREFHYDVLQAVSRLTEDTLRQELKQLVEAELVYQSGRPPQATYLFKHALIQDTAYQSLLKSRRQQLHQQVAQVLEKQLPQTVETQPELVARHYTEAGLALQAVPYWQQAGERATRRSAYVEAISHLSKGLELLKTLPDTPEYAQQELTLQITLGTPLITTKGYTTPEVEKAYSRALELCRRTGETPQLFSVLGRLSAFYPLKGELQTAREIAEQQIRLAQSVQDSVFLSEAYHKLGVILFWLGEFPSAQAHLEQSISLYNSQRHSSRSFLSLQEPKMHCLAYTAWVLWFLGHPDQALEKIREALTLAQEFPHSYSQAWASVPSAEIHQHRREEQLTREHAEVSIALATDLRFPSVLPMGTIMRGWALAEQGQVEEGIGQIQSGLQAMEGELQRPYSLALLAEAYKKVGQIEEGLSRLVEALALVKKNGERWWEAELYRLKGELLLVQEGKNQKAKVKND